MTEVIEGIVIVLLISVISAGSKLILEIIFDKNKS